MKFLLLACKKIPPGMPGVRKMRFLFLLILILSALGQKTFSQTLTNVGTDFWVAFPANNIPRTPQITLFISSEFSTSGTVFSYIPGVTQNFTVVPGVVTKVQIMAGVVLQGGVENKGIRITSNDPISVYGLSRITMSTDAFMALPVASLGTDYTLLTYTAVISGDASRFSVVATEDNTVLTIYNHWTDTTTTVNLNRGQTYMSPWYSQTNQDISGSRIQSNHPVAVFGSNDCVNIPIWSCSACDHILEQIFPSYAWGRNFGTVPLAGRGNYGDIFRILSASDGNQITINGVPVATINTGKYYEADLKGYNYITASNPVMLAQFAKGISCSGGINGDPFMMLIPPLEQFLKHYTIVNVEPFFTQFVNLVAPDYAIDSIYEDGVLIPASDFTRIGITNYYGAQRTVSWGTHNYNGKSPFGVFVYGWNQADSYGYPGGCSMSQVASVKNIILRPDTSYGQLNVTNVTLTATVTDEASTPVEGVLVNFHVSGLGSLTGNSYTDTLGKAQYTYKRTGSTPGTDNVFADVSTILSNTVKVIWTIEPPCANPSYGGTVGNAQTGCIGFVPSPLVSIVAPSGEAGILEYKWQKSTTGSTSGFSDIPNSDSAAYIPGSLPKTTWYKRVARVKCMPGWSGAAESNVLELTVSPTLAVSVGISLAANNLCEGSSAMFNASPVNGGTSPGYLWMVNGVNRGSSAPVFTYVPVNGDKVNCVLISSLSCASGSPASSDTLVMTVIPKVPVTVVITPSANPVCFGDPVTISATPVNGGTVPAYSWYVDGTLQSAYLPDFTFLPNGGETVVCKMISNQGCTINSIAADSLAVKVNKQLKVVDTTICWGVPYFAGGAWQTTAGTYNDTLPAPVNCVMYIETHLHYKPYIPLDLGPDTNLCEGSVKLVVLIPNSSYLWQDGSTDSTYSVTLPGEYYVQVVFEECKVSDTVLVSECEYRLFFPNAFSPNGDGLNDTFHPVGNEVPEFSMRIFNRWGQMIFETTSIEPGWDGTSGGKTCEPDTYVYLVVYKTLTGETFRLKGQVTLSR